MHTPTMYAVIQGPSLWGDGGACPSNVWTEGT